MVPRIHAFPVRATRSHSVHADKPPRGQPAHLRYRTAKREPDRARVRGSRRRDRSGLPCWRITRSSQRIAIPSVADCMQHCSKCKLEYVSTAIRDGRCAGQHRTTEERPWPVRSGRHARGYPACPAASGGFEKRHWRRPSTQRRPCATASGAARPPQPCRQPTHAGQGAAGSRKACPHGKPAGGTRHQARAAAPSPPPAGDRQPDGLPVCRPPTAGWPGGAGPAVGRQSRFSSSSRRHPQAPRVPGHEAATVFDDLLHSAGSARVFGHAPEQRHAERQDSQPSWKPSHDCI